MQVGTTTLASVCQQGSQCTRACGDGILLSAPGYSRCGVQETFARESLNYSMEGQTGNTLNSHRLIALAGQQGLDKQDKLVETLFKAYFTQV